MTLLWKRKLEGVKLSRKRGGNGSFSETREWALIAGDNRGVSVYSFNAPSFITLTHALFFQYQRWPVNSLSAHSSSTVETVTNIGVKILQHTCASVVIVVWILFFSNTPMFLPNHKNAFTAICLVALNSSSTVVACLISFLLSQVPSIIDN